MVYLKLFDGTPIWRNVLLTEIHNLKVFVLCQSNLKDTTFNEEHQNITDWGVEYALSDEIGSVGIQLVFVERLFSKDWTGWIVYWVVDCQHRKQSLTATVNLTE